MYVCMYVCVCELSLTLPQLIFFVYLWKNIFRPLPLFVGMFVTKTGEQKTWEESRSERMSWQGTSPSPRASVHLRTQTTVV